MHGHGKMGVTPASDTARCGNAQAMPLPACWCRVRCPMCKRRHCPTRAKLVRIGRNCRNSQAVPVPNQPIQAEIQKKKKKGANAPFKLKKKNLKTHSSINPIHSHSSALLSLSVLRLPSVLSILRLPCLTDALNHSLRPNLTLHLFFAWLSFSSSPHLTSPTHSQLRYQTNQSF